MWLNFGIYAVAGFLVFVCLLLCACSMLCWVVNVAIFVSLFLCTGVFVAVVIGSSFG